MKVFLQRIRNLFLEQEFFYTKIIFQRALAFIYLIGFLIAFNQGPALIGENGLSPMNLFVSRITFWDSPSLFYFNTSDTFLMVTSLIGVFISILALIGITEKFGYILSIISWFIMWLIYLSIVNVGQTWYGYGWETMLLESGFLAIFLGPSNRDTPRIIIWLLRWVCFRNMLGAGLIKLRGDNCWRDFTCMFYYYETQPVPNPLSHLFHALPKFIHETSIVFTYFIEVIVPFGLLIPRWRIAAIAGGLTFLFHGLITVSGNLAWLNYLSMVLCIPCFCDQVFIKFFKFKTKVVSRIGGIHRWAVYILGVFIVWRSYGPVMNLFAKRQAMNRSFDRLHLVNTYGAFGSITKKRNELVVLGTMNENPKASGKHWKAYEFKGKPTDLNKIPGMMSPYLWKIDWQMWFAAFGTYRYSPWILNFIQKLLLADPKTLGLISKDPFDGKRPKWIKIDFYNYKMKSLSEKGMWKRTYLKEWLPPLNLSHPGFNKILKAYGWK